MKEWQVYPLQVSMPKRFYQHTNHIYDTFLKLQTANAKPHSRAQAFSSY